MRRHRTIYANGAAYRPARGLYAGPASVAIPAGPFLSLHQHRAWPSLWQAVKTRLRKHGFQNSTLRLYRQVLRSFRSHLAISNSAIGIPQSTFGTLLHSDTPTLPYSDTLPHVTPANISSFIDSLVARQTSASWLSTNIAVLRTVFDKLANHNWTRAIPTPKFPFHLPCILSANEINRLVEATPSLRDRLFIGFLHGCGMRTGEVTRLRWRDLDLETRAVTIRNPHTMNVASCQYPTQFCRSSFAANPCVNQTNFSFPAQRRAE